MERFVDMGNLVRDQSESASDVQAEEGQESRVSELSSADDRQEFMARALKKYPMRMNYQVGENTRDSQMGTNIQGYIESVHQRKVMKEMQAASMVGLDAPHLGELLPSSQIDDAQTESS